MTVVAGTAHEAYLKALLPRSRCVLIRTPMRREPRCAKARSISCSAMLSRWRSGSMAPIPRIAVHFAAGLTPTTAIFGKVIGIAVRKGNDTIRLALNWALFRVWERAGLPIYGCAISRSARFELTAAPDASPRVEWRGAARSLPAGAKKNRIAFNFSELRDPYRSGSMINFYP